MFGAQSRRQAASQPNEEASRGRVMNEAILREISDFCRQAGLAESTFGRRAVNDGKLTSRLRNGGRITTETLDRIRTFMTIHNGRESVRPMIIERGARPAAIDPIPTSPAPAN